ncbi:SDR family NAD(P)-dependent oxidoreductase [Amycolatopsis sp. NPDC059090]|uniref:SDR family NAD(P)-dependent oxidoreductase n=1 Tax=unclassified Amycolatopsis TaxID=2618356 RepID=UPI00367077F4
MTTSTAVVPEDLVIAISGGAGLEVSPHLLHEVARGGGLGVVDLADDDSAVRGLRHCRGRTRGRLGVRIGSGNALPLADVEDLLGAKPAVVVLAAGLTWLGSALPAGCRTIVEVTDLGEARAAVHAGAAGLIARGMESGGRVSELSAFVLLQQLLADDAVTVPVWAAGGIGPRTAVASVVGGAAGVVLDSQLLMQPEAVVDDDLRALMRRMDGSEIVREGDLRGLKLGGELLPIGQDGWLAASFAHRWAGTAAAVRGIRQAVRAAATSETAGRSFCVGAPLARTLGTALPVVQGPMTRVSDEAAFAASVADQGGLPTIALSLADPEQSRRMLTEAAAAMGTRPWGAGLLGFAPEALREAQTRLLLEIKPTCAIIAGGRPALAKDLEAAGISTFLHVPSPTLLRQYLVAGTRKFVFEGAECGGHIGSRTSYALWEVQLQVVEDFLVDHPAVPATDLQMLFAGGIHDERSAAMVAAMAGTLSDRGVQVGLVMGTAYLFTDEAVASGAIQPLFRQRAVEATTTSLLETAPGLVTRCLPSPFVDDFHNLRRGLEQAGSSNRELWDQLEVLNVGRLRIASKGLRREGDELVTVDGAVQAEQGLFMAGQVSVLRTAGTTIKTLHTQVTSGAADFHAERLTALRACFEDTQHEKAEPKPVDVAIIGMACVLPGSPDLASFWQTVLSGADRITEVPADRWDADLYYSPTLEPGQAGKITVSRWGGFIDPVPVDAVGYGIPPAALASIDPNQILALEMSNRALRDAGYPYDARDADHARTGVIFGAEGGSEMANAQTLRLVLPAYFGAVPADMENLLPRITEDSFPGVLPNVIAGRVASRLDLGGPNYTVDAACASSLTALDVACKELVGGHSDLMVCGGADLHNNINDYLMFTTVHALSPTGRSRTFDRTGDGIAIGEGVACVVLKRLADAERDGDRVYAVVKGVGAGSDGRAMGLTAPRPEGQRRALDRAYAMAGISPAQVGLVEAHGTGTVVGDRTELRTLTELFADSGAEPGSTALGSVKSQIGHTKCTAGMAGLIKTALALHYGVKPPTINLTRPNAAWDPQTSPFAFHTEASPWATPACERIAGVSAFGFGGTNFHVVLSAHAPTADPRHAQWEWPVELFCFRGNDLAGAHVAVRRLRDEVDAGRSGSMRQLAAAVARNSNPRSGPVRVAVVASDLTELRRLLVRALAGEHDPRGGLVQPSEVPAEGTGKVAFVFPGQGSQRPGALADLFVAFPELREYAVLGREWSDLLFPPTAFDEATAHAQGDRLRDTRVAQPVLGIGGLAVDHVLRRLGIRPDMVAGHSYGELVALCTVGAYEPGALLDLSRERAAAIVAAAGDDPGAMAAVTGSAVEVTDVLEQAGLVGRVVLANHNTPTQAVISGPSHDVAKAVDALAAVGLQARRLPVMCAFHSPVVAQASDAFAAVLEEKAVSAPATPVWSNRTAAPYPADAEGIRAELAAQVAAPVRFVEQLEGMYAAGARVFVETGPGQVITGLVKAVLGERPHLAVACDARPGGGPGNGLRAFLTTIAELACAGVQVRTNWLFDGRDIDSATSVDHSRPHWMVDGQLIRDQHGAVLPGGMAPARRIKENPMASGDDGVPGAGGRDARADLVSQFIHAGRDMIAAQRDIMLALLTGGEPGGRLVREPTQSDLRELPAPVTSLPATGSAVNYAGPMQEVGSASYAAEPVDPVPEQVGAPARQSGQERAPAAGQPDISGVMLAVIGERTGYPEELIEPDLDLEADLSIDSIKRAEVVGEVATRLGLSTSDESTMEELVRSRTVRLMAAALEQQFAARPAAPETVASEGEPPTGNAVPSPAVARVPEPIAGGRVVGRPARRMTVQPVTAALPAGSPRELAGARFLVTGAAEALDALAARLGEHGATVVRRPDDSADLDGLVLLDPLGAGSEGPLPDRVPLLQSFLARAPRWLAAVGRADSRAADGLPGLFRTLALEYPATAVRYVEVEPEVPAGEVANRIIDELTANATEAVVRYRSGMRQGEQTAPADLGRLAVGGAGSSGDGIAEVRALGLDEESVVVLFGGARGITARFALTLAGAARCRVELVGRTPLPTLSEEADLAAAGDMTALRAVLTRHGMRSPAEIERRARGILAGREVAATVSEIGELGTRVRYHTVDVQDVEAMQRLLKQIHNDYGRVDGVVYGAGIIEDKLFAEKTLESFARVYGTKVNGAAAVLEGLDSCGATPSFVVLFGSIAAVYGSRGQTDYAAANDTLETMGARWAAGRERRCLTVHWGPWAPSGSHDGMVTAELVGEYARRGIDLIDPVEGARSLLRELAWADPTATSVVYRA